MRIFEVRYVPEGGTFHAFDKLLRREESVHRVAIHKIKLVDDDVGVVLYELAGDVDRFRELMTELAADFAYQITERDGSIFFYSSFRPNETLQQLIQITDEYELIRIPPMTFEDRGHLASTYVGPDDVFERAMATVPETITVVLDRKSAYRPDRERIRSRLTRKQTAILQSAIERGYYDIPRGVSCEELGEEFGLAGATVGEHLRKAERAVMQEYLSGAPSTVDGTRGHDESGSLARSRPY